MITTGMDILSLLGGLGTGGVTVGGVAWVLIQRYLDSRDKQFEEMKTTLKQAARAEIDGVKDEVREIRNGCLKHGQDTSVATLNANARNLSSTLERIDANVTGLVRDVSGLGATVQNLGGFITDVRTELRDHKRDDHRRSPQ